MALGFFFLHLLDVCVSLEMETSHVFFERREAANVKSAIVVGMTGLDKINLFLE